MPDPFPGVDPYLENPLYWRGLHNGLITFAMAALNAVLPPGFAANYEERVYVIPPERSLYPDLLVLHRPSDLPAPSGSATVIAEQGAPHGILTAYPEEIHEGFVEVRSAEDWDQVVTIIEVLSPANKAAGSAGREEYLQKQGEILRSETHLLEIDLLRRGAHTVAAPLEGLRRQGQWDGLICLHRSVTRYQYEYWFTRIREPLPLVRVPLTTETPDVTLDLQAIYDQAYDTGPYARRMSYRHDPPVPLEEVAFYRETVRKILQEMAAYLPEEESVRTEVILDDARGHYEILQVGWDGVYRVHGALMHVDIREGKIWVEHNGTDFDIVLQMVEAGIPKEKIVLGFYPPEQRQHTDFAVV